MSQKLSAQHRKAIAFEDARKVMVELGELKAARKTYKEQRDFLPDRNDGKFWDKRFQNPLHEHHMEDWRLKTIVGLLDPQKSIVDLGIGAGKLEKLFFSKYPNYELFTGTDITQATLKELQKTLPKIRLVKTGLLKLPFKNDSFDQVLLLEVLEHIKPSETFAVLAEVYRIVKPGGTFFISVPMNEGLEEMLPENPNSHMRMYSEPLLRFELTQAGFAVEKTFTASAFRSNFALKHVINQLLRLKHPNNIIALCRKK